MSMGIDDPDTPSPPISGDNLDPQISQAAGIQDDQASPAAGQGGGGDTAAPQMQPAPDQGTPTSGLLQDAQQTPLNQAMSGGVKKIASLVMGAGAANPQVIEQTQKAVDPGNTQPPGNQNLMALDAAYSKGGVQAAIPLLQANRVAFNAKQAFAYTALNGTPQKPADINAAIDAANQAEQHVLDGSNVKFSHGDRGQITATVTVAGSGQPAQTIPLTVDQFRQYLNVGGDGQWDKLMSKTVPATLQALTKSTTSSAFAGVSQRSPGSAAPAGKTSSPGGNTDGNTGGEDENTPSPANTNQPRAMDVTQGDQADTTGMFDANGHWLGAPASKDPNNYGEELEARSRSIYPDAGHEAERQQWMAAQEEKDLARQNAIDVASEKGKQANERARIMGGYNVQREGVRAEGGVQRAQIAGQAKRDVASTLSTVQKQRLDAQLAREERINTNAQQRNAASLLRQKLAGAVTDPLTPQETAQVSNMISAGQPGTRAPQVTPPTGQAQRPPGIPAGAKQYQGKWYTRGPNGEAVPVQ